MRKGDRERERWHKQGKYRIKRLDKSMFRNSKRDIQSMTDRKK